MCFGIVVMGLGISLFKISLMGNDPSSAMVMALGEKLGIDFSIMLIIMNSLFFLVEILLAFWQGNDWNRHLCQLVLRRDIGVFLYPVDHFFLDCAGRFSAQTTADGRWGAGTEPVCFAVPDGRLGNFTV